MRFALFYLIFLGSFPLVAANEIYPAGCKAQVVRGEAASLHAKEPQLMLIHNLLEHDLWLTHPVEEAAASAGWASRIQAGNWSALVVADNHFILNCVESKPGHEQKVACDEVIAVCSWDKMTLSPEQSTSSYWAGEDMPLSPLIAYLSRRGFSIPVVTQ